MKVDLKIDGNEAYDCDVYVKLKFNKAVTAAVCLQDCESQIKMIKCLFLISWAWWQQNNRMTIIWEEKGKGTNNDVTTFHETTTELHEYVYNGNEGGE